MSDMKTFKEAYAILQKHAQTLRTQQEPDIDNLTTIVSESLAAHKVCKERIDAVEKALEQSLGTAQLEDASGRKLAEKTQPPGTSSGSDEGDDIPF